MEILEQFPFKKIRQKAITSLKMWGLGHWPIRLVTRPLSALEILQDQAQGRRAVSVVIQDIPTPIFHRADAFDFFVHDLEHAFLFFADSTSYQRQTLFFKQLLRSCQPTLEDSMWSPYLEDLEFKTKFEYLMSDMNTHIEHYRAYLKAILPHNHFDQFCFLFDKT